MRELDEEACGICKNDLEKLKSFRLKVYGAIALGAFLLSVYGVSLLGIFQTLNKIKKESLKLSFKIKKL